MELRKFKYLITGETNLVLRNLVTSIKILNLPRPVEFILTIEDPSYLLESPESEDGCLDFSKVLHENSDWKSLRLQSKNIEDCLAGEIIKELRGKEEPKKEEKEELDTKEPKKELETKEPKEEENEGKEDARFTEIQNIYEKTFNFSAVSYKYSLDYSLILTPEERSKLIFEINGYRLERHGIPMIA